MTTITFKSGKASARLVLMAPGRFALSNLWSQVRGQGDARDVMRQIAAYADKHNYTIMLTAQRYGSANRVALDNSQLEQFYAKFGFVKQGLRKPAFMIRYPRKKNVPYSRDPTKEHHDTHHARDHEHD